MKVKLIEAAKEGDVEKISEILADEEAHSSAYEALCWAAYKGHVLAVKRLLKIAAVTDATAMMSDDFGADTPLQLAARSGHLSVVQCLLEIPAIKEAAAMRTPIMGSNAALRDAACHHHFDVVQCLVSIPAVQEHPSFKGLQEFYPIIKEAMKRIIAEENFFNKGFCKQFEASVANEADLTMKEGLSSFSPRKKEGKSLNRH